MNIFSDKRIVLTLDAGGTNFVFGAMQGGTQLVEPLSRPSNAHDLTLCLDGLVDGFNTIKATLAAEPTAISFAFPGPADYQNGIIGDLQNLPAFRGGVALGPMLRAKFGIPVFIQNDGDLFAYGEALCGIQNEINEALTNAGVGKQYRNIVGVTLGTGFGAGIVHDGTLITGDNSIGAEIWNTPNSISPERNTEDGVSTRAIIHVFEALTREQGQGLMPHDIAKIAQQEQDDSRKQAAISAFETFGTHLGDALCNLIMLFDCNVVIGGGLTGAAPLYSPAMFKVMNGNFANGQARLVHKVFNYDEVEQRSAFLTIEPLKVNVPYSTDVVEYFAEPRVVVATSRIGASKAIALGAYAYALKMLDTQVLLD